MRFCTNCGDKLEDNIRFCTNCGAKINVEPIAFDDVKTVFAETVEVPPAPRPVVNEVPPAPQPVVNEAPPAPQPTYNMNDIGFQNVNMQSYDNQVYVNQQYPVNLQQGSYIEQAMEQVTEKKKSSKKIIIALVSVAIIVIIGAGAALFGRYYFSPAKKFERALSNGYKALVEKNWEEALESFDKAIVMDNDSFNAYYGKLQACLEIDDQEQKEEVYAEVIDVIEGLDEEAIEENQEDIVEIYLESTNSVYADDEEKAVTILEKGYNLTADDKIKGKLIDIYADNVYDSIESEDFDNAFAKVDKLIKLDEKDKKVQKVASELINKRINDLFENKDFAAVRELYGVYGEVIATTDFESVIAQIDEIEAKDKKMNDFMQKVYDNMLTEDFAAMSKIDGSEEAEEIASMIEGDNHYYIPSGEASGTGVGLCKFGDGGYYFYFGNIENGIKSGKGNAYILMLNNGSYRYLSGEWKNDAPNGNCVLKVVGSVMNTSGDEYNETLAGNMKNGLWDGYISDKVYSNGTTFYLDFEAKDGLPVEFLTDEFNEKFGYDEEYVYAYDIDSNGYITWATLGYENDTLGWNGFES